MSGVSAQTGSGEGAEGRIVAAVAVADLADDTAAWMVVVRSAVALARG